LILKSAIDVTQGVNSTTGVAISTVRRAVLCGAQAAVVAYGQKNSPSKYRWNEELIDSSVVARAANDNWVNSGELLAA
jgi:hypothetical protein